jgi:hypothetical protein
MSKSVAVLEDIPPFPLDDASRDITRGWRRPVCLADIQPEKVRWLWQGYIPLGAVTIIQGDPGVGKGTLTADIAARVTQGMPMPLDDFPTEPRNVLLLSTAEDDLRATILPRMMAAGADRSRAHAFEDVMEIPGDLCFVQDMIQEYKSTLVIFDPLNAYLSEKVDGHKDQHVRKALTPLKIIAEQTGAAIVLVHHLNKAPGGKAMYRGGGSIGITGAARCVLLIEEHPQKPENRVIARVKGNLSAPPPSLEFTLESHREYGVPTIQWGGVVTYTADQLLSGLSKDTNYTETVIKACEFYRQELEDGEEHSSEEIEQKREEAGISERTGKRVRKLLGVRSRKEGFGANQKWFIHLPKDVPATAENTQDALSEEPDPLGTLDTLREHIGEECLESVKSAIEEGEDFSWELIEEDADLDEDEL